MLLPFDHITIGDMEFVLHYRHVGVSLSGPNSLEWHAIDVYGNDVVVRERDMVKLPPMAYDGDKKLFQPTFYRYCKDSFERINSTILSDCVASGVQSGSFLDSDGCEWHWDIPKRTIESQSKKYALEVFSTGGWWIYPVDLS
jgi:hypothetical protein